MPTVPVYNRQPIQTEGLPNVRQNPQVGLDVFGGGETSREVQRAEIGLNNEVFRIAHEAKKQADQIAFQDYDSKLSELQTSIQVNSQKLKGKDASAALGLANQQWREGIQNLDGTLSNDDQKFAAKRAQSTRWDSLNRTLQIYQASEQEAYDNQSTQSYLNNARNEAITNFLNPDEINMSIARQNGALTEFANRNGKGADWLKEKSSEASSKTHSAVIARMLDNDQDLLASQYFKGVKDQIAGDDIGHVEKMLEDGSLRGQSQRNVDSYLKNGFSMTQAMDEARKIEDPKLRDETTQRLKNDYTSIREAKRIDSEKRYQRLADDLEKSHGQVELNTLGMPLDEKQALQRYKSQLISGEEAPSLTQDYYDLMNLASADPTDFMKMNLLLYKGKVKELPELIKMQYSMRSKDGESEKILNGFRTKKQIVDETLNSIGIDPTPKPGTNNAEKLNQFNQIIDRQILDTQSKTGKPVNTEQVQKIVNDAASNVIVNKGFIWDTKKRGFEVTIKDIPDAEKIKIVSALNKNGIPVNDDNILKLFIKVNRAH